MGFLLDQIGLYEALAFLAIGVAFTAFGAGLGWVGAALRAHSAEESLRTAGMRISKLASELADAQKELTAVREELAVIRAEFRMQGQMMLTAQRSLEAATLEANELRREMIRIKTAAVVINAGNDATIGGDLVSRDKNESR